MIGATPTQRTISSLTEGTIYQFNVISVNDHGDGASAGPVTIKAALTPEQMDPVSITESGTNVVFSWTAPDDNGDDIDEYRFKVYDEVSLDFETDTALCNGAHSGTIASTSCTIPMVDLVSSFHISAAGTTIRATIEAHNSKGWSDPSDESSDVVLYKTQPAVAPEFT